MVDVPQLLNKEEAAIDLPPGFRFHPTDEEIITHYLTPKLINHAFTARAIGEVDLNKCEPWDLPSKAKMGGKDHYFFCQRDRKYPTGMRTNRATESGYWKATGKDKEIYRGKGVLVGMKKTLVFYKGRAPKGGKTNWVMHEFRVDGKYSLPNLPKSAKDEWVVCRVFHKTMGVKKSTPPGLESINSYGDDHHLLDSTSWSPLMDPPRMESYVTPSSSFIHSDHIFDSKAPTLPSVGLDSNPQVILSQQNMVSSNPSPQSSYYSLLRSVNLDYLHHDEAILPQALVAANNGVAASAMRMHCKMTQYPNPLMDCPLQDVGLSTDRTAEVSSAPIEKLRELGRSMDDDGLWILTASINGHEGDRLVYN